MLKRLAHFLFRYNGWRFDSNGVDVKELGKCVLIAAPHTSNWDLIYGLAAFNMLGLEVRFTIKKEWVSFPFKTLFESAGAIGIDRQKARHGDDNMVQVMARLFDEHERLAIAVVPEGTRSLRKRWRIGFYHVALEAGVPLALGYLDYENKVAGVAKVVHLTGDIHQDLGQVMEYYQHSKPCYPEKFSPDLRYLPGAKAEDSQAG